MKFISLFAGIGGFDLVLERLGHECIYANDIDKYCKITYDKHFTTKLTLKNITEIQPNEIPDADLICGGFPCQSFSIAGKRGGFNDIRGTLFFEVVRIAREKQPRFLFLENVKGLLNHERGETFRVIISTLDELGYDLQWQVLNSKNFEVPQNRERVFIVGHLRGTARPQVFPIGENTTASQINIIGTTLGEENKRRGDRDIVYDTKGIMGAIKSTDYKQPPQIIQLNKPNHSNYRVYGSNGISPTLNTMQGGDRQPKIEMKTANTLTPDAYLTRGERKRVDGKAVLTSMYERRVRRLTPLECERLQGFPDNWTAGVSDTQRYKQLGNAVTVNVVYEIAKQLTNSSQSVTIKP